MAARNHASHHSRDGEAIAPVRADAAEIQRALVQQNWNFARALQAAILFGRETVKGCLGYEGGPGLAPRSRRHAAHVLSP
jgi:hypothetical protein